MGKNGKHKRLANSEAYQRINFLYQAAHLCLQQSPSNSELCRTYIHTLRSVAEKNVLRLCGSQYSTQQNYFCVKFVHEGSDYKYNELLTRHPDMKRTICKKCCMLLLPGITAICRNKKKGDRYTVVSCLECGNVKRYLWRKNYQLWVEKPEAWMPS